VKAVDPGVLDGGIPAERADWASALELLVESARSGTFPPGFEVATVAAVFFHSRDPSCGLDEAARDIVGDRALLVLWYWWYRGNLGEEESASLGAWLESLCRSAQAVPSEVVRGRLIWIRLNLLDQRSSDNEIEKYIRGLHDAEQSAYVWERIAAFLGGWNSTWRIYLELHTWPQLAERDGFSGAAGITTRQSGLFEGGLTIVEGYRSRLHSLVDASIHGTLPHGAIDWIFERYAEAGFAFPLSVDEFSSWYNGPDRASRILLLKWLERYVPKALEGSLDQGFLSIIAEGGRGNPGRLERVAGRIASAELERRAGNPDGAWLALLETIREAQRGTGDCIDTVSAQDLHQKLEPRIISVVANGGIAEPGLDMIEYFLGSPSGFIQALAVDMSLALWRSGHAVDSLVRALKTVLTASPETTGLMETKGADLPDASSIKFFFVPHVDSFLEAAESAGEAEGGFMNLGNRTGLLEVVTRPSTAWRAATLLRGIAEQRGDAGLIDFLTQYREVNEVLADLEPITEVPATHVATPREGSSKHRRTKTAQFLPLEGSPVVGPLTVPEIAIAMASLAASSDGKPAKSRNAARELRDSLSASITERYARTLDDSRHASIRSIFGDGTAEPPGFFATVYGTMEEAGGVVQPDHTCHKVPDDHDPDSWNADVLAWYQPRAYLGPEDGHGFGVHFCARNIMRCVKATQADPGTLVRVVAVHEWFHAFMELVLGNDAYVAHNMRHGKSGFCRLEEAAANALARVYMNDLIDELRAPIETALFIEPERTGVKGYGEWKLLGTDPQTFLPALVRSGKHVDPPGYMLERTSAGFLHDGFEMSVATGNWKSLLAGLEGETVPCWIDFRGLVD